MIQLYINGKLCDIDDEMDIRLEKNFENTDEHVIEETEYSFEVDLPVTERNREAFGFVDVFDVGAKFNQSYDASLNVDEVNILKGKFLLEEIDSEYYSGNLYVPAGKSLKDVLGNKKMKEIKEHKFDISDWEHIKEQQWNVIKGDTTKDLHIGFPYVLYRLPYNNTESTLPITTQDLAASGNTFSVENVFPAYNVLSVIKDIFEGEGYKIQGNIFSMKKFTDLYQTFNYDPKDYHNDKVVPYYLSFDFDYVLRRGDNTSSTARIVELFDDPSMRWGTDAMLLSENTVFSNEEDDYNMLVKGKNTNARTITIPKSGWWEVMLTGRMGFPTQNGSWGQDERVTVCGNYNDADKVDLSQNIVEFQVKKTSQPLSDAKLYSFNMGNPINPTEIDKSKVRYANDESYFSVLFHGAPGIELSHDEARNKFPKNQATALVKGFGDFDTSEFIAGVRWGCQYSSRLYPHGDGDPLDDRASEEMVFTCLPNPSKATMVRDNNEDKSMFMPMYYINGRQNWSQDYRFDYGSSTAQILARNDSYSNFEGYNKFTPNTTGSGGTWDTSSNFERRVYPGQNWSTAYTTSCYSDAPDCGFGLIHTCVWLEEGDNISLEAMMPYNDYADECGWAEFCDWKHFYDSGVNNTTFNFRCRFAFIASDKKYVPTEEQPLPNLLNTDDWNDWRDSRYTNVNKFLGDDKVNDYIENFLKTFNLKLTRVNKTTYSIDTFVSDLDTKGNVIDIDQWANVKDAEFRRIDTKNTTLEWTISTDEEGYVHGNNTKEVKTARDESGYTGSITFENHASNTEEKIKSNFSYTWLKDISFVNGGDLNKDVKVHEVPVIGDAEMWENNYITIEGQAYATDKTPRLIYFDRDTETNLVNYFWIEGYVPDTKVSEYKCPLLFCKNYITYKSSLGSNKTFRLDYNNTESTESDQTITDVFFNIKNGAQYEIDLPVTLPNDIYASIKANTLVKFNDGLFRVMGIEGHNVSMNDQATLKLITLN